MPRTPNTPTVLATYRRIVPLRVRRRISARIPPALRARLRPPKASPRSEVRVLHASVDGGDTLNLAATMETAWPNGILVLRRAERSIELPTRITTDLSGLRRAESSVRLAADTRQASAVPIVVVNTGTWRVELRDGSGEGWASLMHDRDRAQSLPQGRSWAIGGAPGAAVVVEATTPEPYPYIEEIAIGFTKIEIAGTLAASRVSPVAVIVRLKDESWELQAPATHEGHRFRALLPLDDMVGRDGVWECHLQVGTEARRVLARRSGKSDRRFDINTPIGLVAASDGRLVRVRGYTTKAGELNISTATINEESS